MLTPETAWDPLPQTEWTPETARHLAVRLGFSINPSLVRLVHERGPAGTLQSLLGEVKPFAEMSHVSGMRESMGERYKEMQNSSPQEKRKMRQELQKENRQSYARFGLDWLHQRI